MLYVRGRYWGTDQQIADALGTDITPAMIRRWADRKGLQRVTIPGVGVRYPLDQAAAIEATVTTSGRGRRRARVDFHPMLV